MVQGGREQRGFTFAIKLLDMGSDNLDSEQTTKITVNEFLKEIKKHFGSFEYKATSKNGQVFKSSGYDKKNK
jgi:hypothetical protein